ncbi:MAG: leucine-rich repeat domain-containing protein, partial [Clostridia bacterium]|nr:leucine-rich repeat domain-containing protein [Clostridia bacterium]
MNEKKKLLSLFLCLALLFSMLSTTLVSADGWNPTTVAEVTGENTVTIQATRKGVYVKFTPTESGEYIIYSKSDYDPYAYLYDSDNNQLCYNDDYYYGDYENGNDFCLFAELNAGEEYFVQVKIYRKKTFDVVFEKAADDYVYQRTFSKGDFQYQILEDGTYEIQGFANNYQTPTDLENFSIKIPSEVKGKPVTKIASYAFNCCDIKNVTIPDSVTIIDEGAFEDCYNLKSVTVPDSVTSIGYYAFGWCYSLTSVSIPKNVSNIGEGAFKYCYSLTSINVDSQNKDYSSVEGVLFNKDKTELLQYPAKKANESYSIPGSVTSISDDAFRSCSSLTSVTIPDSVTSIGSYAFDDCEKLSKITIGNGVTSIGVNAFNYTAYYNNEANWEKDVLYIGKYLVVAKSCSWTGHWDENNGWVEEYIPGISGDCTIKDGTKLIADSAFSDRYELTGITIPNSVVIIGNRAFNGCEKLSKITIGSGVTSIGASAFHYTAYYNDNSKWENGVLYIGKYLLDARDDYYDGYWDENDNWIEGDHIPGIPEDYTIKSGTTLIADYAFEGCYDLSKVTIPGSIMFFGDDAFSYCSNLSKVTILEGVKSIGNYAFYDCYNLSKVTIAEGVKTIGDYAFYNCGSLNVVKIPVSVTEFGEKALGYNSYYSEEEDISTDKASENFIIMGYNDTMAESYAKENGFEFILIGCLHKEVIDNAVAATCTGIGLTEGKYCSV